DDDDEDNDDNDKEEELAKSDEEDKETVKGGDEVKESEGNIKGEWRYLIPAELQFITTCSYPTIKTSKSRLVLL
nr:hypothetical protein [Tanacetum cinerariifolium]